MSEPNGVIVNGPEIKAMVAINKALAALSEEARKRLLAWVVGKYGNPAEAK